jgi:hypothetical protein
VRRILGTIPLSSMMWSSIKSEPDMLRLRQPSAKRHGGTPNRRMRQRTSQKDKLIMKGMQLSGPIGAKEPIVFNGELG